MKTILTIIKKEFARFFKDTRLWITAILLPGVLIFTLYSLMGSIMDNVTNEDKDVPCSVFVVGMPKSQSAAFNSVFDIKDDYTPANAMEAVKDGTLDLFISFPDAFDELVAAYVPSSGVAAPHVCIYYNDAQTKSMEAYGRATGLLDAYEQNLVNKFDVNKGQPDLYNLADAQSTSRTVLAMVVPMVLLMLLFSGCMAVAPESIAGEKERGTIATLLVTPVKRSHIAIGKIIALSAIALLSGISSCIGLVLSLPKLAGSASGVTFSIYGFGDFAAIFAVVLSTVLILVSIISIISAFAKSVKEASGLVVPVMLVTMLCGVFCMFAGSAASLGLYFIPIFNSALMISSVLSGTMSGAAIAVTVCVNIVFAGLLVFALTQMFKSERIMFNK